MMKAHEESQRARTEPLRPEQGSGERNDKIYNKSSRQTKQHIHTCMFCGQSGTELSNEQHSTLIAQRERLLRLLRPVTSPTACYCAVMKGEKCWHCEARELITTIEHDQIATRTTTGREG